MEKMTKKERRELIAAAIKTISEQQNLSLEARKRGLATLQRALLKTNDHE